MGETPANGDALSHRNARILVAVGDEKRRQALMGFLTPDGYAFVAQPKDGNGNALIIIAESHALDRRWLEGARSVGITAGASAPDILVEELVARLLDMAGAEVEFLPGVTENVRFRMPPQLADTPARA